MNQDVTALVKSLPVQKVQTLLFSAIVLLLPRLLDLYQLPLPPPPLLLKILLAQRLDSAHLLFVLAALSNDRNFPVLRLIVDSHSQQLHLIQFRGFLLCLILVLPVLCAHAAHSHLQLPPASQIACELDHLLAIEVWHL